MKEKLRQQARGQAREKAEAYLKDLSIEEQAMLLKYESPAIPKAGIPEYNWWNEALHGWREPEQLPYSRFPSPWLHLLTKNW